MPIKLCAGLHATDLKLHSCTVEHAAEYFSGFFREAKLGTPIAADQIALYRCTKVHPKAHGQDHTAPSSASTDRIEEGQVIMAILPNNSVFGSQHADDMLAKARHYEQEAIRLEERLQEMQEQYKLLEEKLLKEGSALYQAQLDRDEATTRLKEYMRLHPAEEREPVSPSTAADSPLPSASPFPQEAPSDGKAPGGGGGGEKVPVAVATAAAVLDEAGAWRAAAESPEEAHTTETTEVTSEEREPVSPSTAADSPLPSASPFPQEAPSDGKAPGGGGGGEKVPVAVAAAAAVLDEAGAGRAAAESPEEAHTTETTEGTSASDAHHPKPPPAKAKPAAKQSAKSTPPQPKTKTASVTAAKQPPGTAGKAKPEGNKATAAGKAKPEGNKATAACKRTGGPPHVTVAHEGDKWPGEGGAEGQGSRLVPKVVRQVVSGGAAVAKEVRKEQGDAAAPSQAGTKGRQKWVPKGSCAAASPPVGNPGGGGAKPVYGGVTILQRDPNAPPAPNRRLTCRDAPPPPLLSYEERLEEYEIFKVWELGMAPSPTRPPTTAEVANRLINHHLQYRPNGNRRRQ
ncbi:unnamed protein product [Vitrella brassicaformis CCMP3155]|uniref:Uncharacterized protein n=1 Tax=Vitrella brassicaformis (strain CCMP3155) TaxID=1169540 RepID=A0A0G4EXE8_VITBC|nr:unnamed protein product [Vitrella brassicaformis CCMP3155]|eukprot:CEM03249.1 unnamed protein product [Vitrella brassicaformis CCMP3155]